MLGSNTKNLDYYYARFFLNSPIFVRKYSYLLFRKITLHVISNAKFPSRIIYYATNKCNFNCQHCFYVGEINNTIRQDLTLSEIKFMCNFLPPEIKLITITGGEPMLRDDIYEICRTFAHYENIKTISINSNGYFPEYTEYVIQRLISFFPRININVQISLDGFKETHNKLRRNEKSFDNALETLFRLNKYYVKCNNFNRLSILTVVSKMNLGEILSFSRFIRSKFNILHKYQLLRANYCKKKNDFFIQNALSIEECLNFVELLENKIPKTNNPLMRDIEINTWHNIIDIMRRDNYSLRCLAGRLEGVIYSDGMVGLCEEDNEIGNLREYGYNFSKIWNSKKADNARVRIGKCRCLNFCHLKLSSCFFPRTVWI